MTRDPFAATPASITPEHSDKAAEQASIAASPEVVFARLPRTRKTAGRARPHLLSAPRWAASAIALGSGLMNLLSVLDPWIPGDHPLLREIFPLEFVRLSRFLVLLIGFALIASSLNLYRRKRRAWQIAMALSGLSFIFNLTKGLDYPEAVLSLALGGILWLTRKQFVVKSSPPDLRWAVIRLGVAVAVALAYGVWGFWILDPRDFGINFTVGPSIRHTLEFFTLVSPPQITPHTRHGLWFFHSMYVIAVA